MQNRKQQMVAPASITRTGNQHEEGFCGKLQKAERFAGGQKKVYLEILRVIAIFGVLFCHSGYFGIHHYAEAQNRANYWLGIFLASVAQCCIPLFFIRFSVSTEVCAGSDGSFLYLFLGYEVVNDLFRVLAYYQEWGTSLLEFPMFPDIIVYSIMGYYLESVSGDIFYKKKNILILAAVSILLAAEAMHLNHLSFAEGGLVEYGDLFVMAYAMVIFVVVRHICSCRSIPVILERIL